MKYVLSMILGFGVVGLTVGMAIKIPEDVVLNCFLAGLAFGSTMFNLIAAVDWMCRREENTHA